MKPELIILLIDLQVVWLLCVLYYGLGKLNITVIIWDPIKDLLIMISEWKTVGSGTHPGKQIVFILCPFSQKSLLCREQLLPLFDAQ